MSKVVKLKICMTPYISHDALHLKIGGATTLTSFKYETGRVEHCDQAFQHFHINLFQIL